MIKVSICDDDALCLQNTKEFLSRWALQNNIQIAVECFDNGDLLLKHCMHGHTDIILLDIMMPLLNGMDVAKELRKSDRSTKIIFLTSSPMYAIESYDVNASGYILKPVSYEKLCTVLNNCMESLNEKSDSIMIRTAYGYQNIYLHQIECVEAQNKKVIFTMHNGSTHEVYGSLASFEEMLTCEKGFFKCHRSYLVYIPAVDYFTVSKILTKSGCSIPVARGKGKSFEEFYFSYMFTSRGDHKL